MSSIMINLLISFPLYVLLCFCISRGCELFILVWNFCVYLRKNNYLENPPICMKWPLFFTVLKIKKIIFSIIVYLYWNCKILWRSMLQVLWIKLPTTSIFRKFEISIQAYVNQVSEVGRMKGLETIRGRGHYINIL